LVVSVNAEYPSNAGYPSGHYGRHVHAADAGYPSAASLPWCSEHLSAARLCAGTGAIVPAAFPVRFITSS
jgi:hypothetical protein